MNIPVGAIAPICIVSFVVSAFEYYRIDPQRRVLNLQFAVMAGSIVVLLGDVSRPDWSIAWLPLALIFLVTALYYLRMLPPSRH